MAKVTLNQLEAFYWVVRLGGFRVAATHLGLSQPTISIRVRELEGRLGCVLLDRSGQSTRTTADGAELLAYAERFLALSDEMAERLGNRDSLRGRFRLGVIDSFALVFLSSLLQALERQHPALRVELTVDYSHRLSHLLDQGDLDLAFLNEPRVSDHVASERLGLVDRRWVASPLMRLPERTLTPADLAGRQILSMPSPSHLFSTVMQWFAGSGLGPQRLSTCNNLTIMVRLACDGVGLCVLPTMIVAEELKAVRLRILATEPVVQPHAMFVAHTSKEVTPSVLAVIIAAKELLRHSRHLRSGSESSLVT